MNRKLGIIASLATLAFVLAFTVSMLAGRERNAEVAFAAVYAVLIASLITLRSPPTALPRCPARLTRC